MHAVRVLIAPIVGIPLLAIVLAVVIVTVASGTDPTSGPTRVLVQTDSDKTLVFSYDSWPGTYLSIYVLKEIFEDELGYSVKVGGPLETADAYAAVGREEADIFTDPWFPGIRNATLERDLNLVKLGFVFGGKARDAVSSVMISSDFAREYRITHMRDLNDPVIARALDTDGDGKGNLIGAPFDWESAKSVPEILEHYGLADLYEVDPSESEPDLVARVDERLRQGSPALFYMIRPVAFPGGLRVTDHARFLEGTETLMALSFVRNVVRGDFIAYHPEAAKILSRYKISGEDIGLFMGRVAEEGDSEEVLTRLAATWIAEHRAEVDSWLVGLRGRERPETLPEETLPVAYSLDKEELFLDLAIEFNLSREAGTLPVLPVRRHMVDMLEEALAGEYAAISPDSSVWLDQLDLMWEERGLGAGLIGATVRYAVSPLIIAMRESQAVAMGYPAEAIGWADLTERAAADPEYRWSHASATTASGLLALTAEFYGGAKKQDGLTVADLQDEATREFVRKVESTVRRYGGEPENYVVMRMLAEGGLPLDAFAVTERWVVYFNQQSDEERLVAIYPEEGTFWMDHPLVLLNGPWVSEGQKQAFRAFANFTEGPSGQGVVLVKGYRPAGNPMFFPQAESPINAEYRVDPAEPTTLLGMPEAQVLQNVRIAWRSLKKPANIYLVVDVSGSMRGDRIARTKEALISFIDEVVGDRDQVALVVFSDDVRELQGLKPLDKGSLKTSISTLNTGGGTQLYEALAFAYDMLQDQGESERINVIVGMTDGLSAGSITVIESRLQEPDHPVLVFLVAYGDEPELGVLERIALLGGGKAYPSDARTIKKLYLLLSAFF